MKSAAIKYLRSLLNRAETRRKAEPYPKKSKAELYSQEIRSRKVYFSIHVPQHVGFTDQTMLVALLYKLGALLELDYHYTPVHDSMSVRQMGISDDVDWNETQTGQYSGIFDYVGFDLFFQQKSKIANVEAMHSVDIIFRRKKVANRQLTSSKEMINHIRKLIVAALPDGDEPLHVRFDIVRQGDVIKWMHELPNDLLDFDYTDVYWQFRAQHAVPEVFENYSPKLLMHIRQGDTAVVQTPWNSYVQIWGKGKDAFSERESVDEIQDNVVITVEDFENFYAALKEELALASLSTLVHSDGFSRALFRLNKYRDKLDLATEKAELLQRNRADYNDRAFEVFNRHREAQLFVGEELHLLYELIHAFYTCDIILVGTQQRMLAKQYAYSFMNESEKHPSPMLVTLYKNEPPDYGIYGNQHMLDRSLNVDLMNYKITDVATRVAAFLSERY